MAIVGETIRIDHGDKVVERCIISVSETYVRSRSRWISGTPYVDKPSNCEWTCTPEAWERHIEQMRSLGKLLSHHIPSTEVIMDRYIVMDASACMPANCWGRYRRVGVVEVEAGAVPKMLSERACGVVRVVQTWERLNHGTSDRCAYRVALAEAHELADKLNGENR